MLTLLRAHFCFISFIMLLWRFLEIKWKKKHSWMYLRQQGSWLNMNESNSGNICTILCCPRVSHVYEKQTSPYGSRAEWGPHTHTVQHHSDQLVRYTDSFETPTFGTVWKKTGTFKKGLAGDRMNQSVDQTQASREEKYSPLLIKVMQFMNLVLPL